MANNNIVSPGIYINETDQQFIPEGIVEAGAAIVGSTAKGPVNIPTLVSSYGDFVAKFGDIITSGSGANVTTHPSFLAQAAYNYFTNGGSTLLVSRAVRGNYTSATASIAGTDITKTSFVLNTRAAGADQNSATTTANSNGLFPSGSNLNLRYEITNSNTESGAFTLVIRRGDDDDNNKTILEQYNGLTLDPYDNNYIGKAIGTQYSSVEGSGADVYIQVNGEYPNVSKYVYASNILDTPNYSDSEGNVRVNAYTGSIPANTAGGASSTGFDGGTGQLGASAKFGKDIIDDNIEGLQAADFTASFYLLNDTQFKYTSIAAPGLVYSNDSTELNILLENSKERGDTIALVDLGYYTATISNVTALAKTINNSYAAAYYPWLMANDPATGKATWAPASTFIPGVYAYNDKVGEPWFAPAGLNRGALPTVVRTQRTLSKTNRDDLYASKINPITSFPGAGVVVFGQKTLQTKASSLDRINVRRLLINIKQFLDQQSGNVVFEANTQATRNNFLAIVNPYLESVQQRNGLYAFKVVMDESINTAAVIDRNELVGQVYLQPTKTAEFVILNFNVQPTGATFPA